MMKHRRAIALLGPYCDGEMEATQRADLETHLRQCQTCQTALARMRRSSDQLRFWWAPVRTAEEEQAFVGRLVRSLPSRPTTLAVVRCQRPISSWRRSYTVPAVLVLSSAFVQAAAVLAMASGILATTGVMGDLEARLRQFVAAAGDITSGTLAQLTWVGWLWGQLSASVGLRTTSVAAWIDWLLGSIAPTVILVDVLFFIFVGLAIWIGLSLRRERSEARTLPAGGS